MNGIYKKKKKIIAIGDLHGDMLQLLSILKDSNLIKHKYGKKCIDKCDFNIKKWNWSGKNTYLIQMGDIFDGGGRKIIDSFEDNEVEIFIFLIKLKYLAKKKGGNVLMIFGNHEYMNFNYDFRYVQDESKKKCLTYNKNKYEIEFKKKSYDCDDRKKLFERGKNPLALLMSRYCFGILKVGSNIFVHGGANKDLSKEYSINKMNNLLKKYLINKLNNNEEDDFKKIYGKDGLIWYRDFVKNNSLESCEDLDKSLKNLKGKRMIVGHTVQKNIKKKCERFNRNLWAIDVGLSRAFRSSNIICEYLEILDDSIINIKKCKMLKECNNL